MENKQKKLSTLLPTIETMITEGSDAGKVLQGVCDFLHANVPGYDWVGFYLVDPQNERELILGPYAGEPTEHVRIPFGRGICGQAAEKEEPIIVDDVSAETNYLSCNINVRSEIVLPIFRNGIIAGELDLDSHRPSHFDDYDREFLATICDRLSMIV